MAKKKKGKWSLMTATVTSLVFFWLNIAAAQTLYVDEQFGFSLTSGVVFASKPAGSPVSNMDLALELYEPGGVSVPENRPAVILIHGGGFVSGNRFNSRLIEMCERMARRGYSCVSIDYRLQGDAPVVDASFQAIADLFSVLGPGDPRGPAVAAAAEDGWAAYEWLVNNAVTLNIDVDRIAVGGSSAGAVTALYLGYGLEEIGVAPANTFAAVFDMWGAFLGPDTYIMSGDAPLLITHGDADTTVPVEAANALVTRAEAIGLEFERHILPGVGHGYDIFSVLVTPTETMFDRVVDFFYEHVAPNQSNSVDVPLLPIPASIMILLIVLVVAYHHVARGTRIIKKSSDLS